MPKGKQRDWPGEAELLALAGRCTTKQEMRLALDVPWPTLQSHIRRCGLEQKVMAALKAKPKTEPTPDTGELRPGVQQKDDSATVISPASSKPQDIPALLRHWDLDPDEWEVHACKVNSWDAMTSDKKHGDNQIVRMHQLTLQLRRKVPIELLFPARDVKPRRPPAPPRRASRTRLVAYLSDQHAPYHDPRAHAAVLAFLSREKPDRVILGGDGGDYGSISKHRDNPAWNAPPQECIDAQFALYVDYREAAPDAEFDMLPGNHDDRLRTEQLTRAERTYGIKPAHIPGRPQIEAYSMRHLLHLDELHINYVGPPREGDNYEHAEILITPDLVATHGFKTGPDAAQKHAEAMGQSVLFGHTHAQALMPVVVYRDGAPVILWGINAGCLCLTVGLGYAKRPKWTQGWATATLFPDGRFRPELATIVDGTAFWRNERYAGRALKAAA